MAAANTACSDQKEKSLSLDVLERMHAVMHRFRTEQYRVLRDGPFDITHMEGRLLCFISQNPGCSLSALVAHFDRDKGQLARLVKTLKAQGLVDAEADRQDRRCVRLQLSEDGQEVFELLRRQWRILARQALEEFTPEESAMLLVFLERMQANLENV